MARLTLATHFLQRLAATERGTPERKAVWADIRAEYGVPPDVKIGVETSPTHPNVGQVYIKDTDPRQFILADGYGRYTAGRETAPTDGAAPATDSAASTARFVAIDPDDDGTRRALVKINKQELLHVLRGAIDTGEADFSRVNVKLDGFPAMQDDTIVLDNRTGDLYLFIFD